MVNYCFKVALVRPNVQFQVHRYTPSGQWLPPKGVNDHKICSFNIRGRRRPIEFYFEHNSERRDGRPQTTMIAELSPHLIEYKSQTLYYSRGIFSTVPLDATTTHVGDGANFSFEDGEDRDSEEEDDDDDVECHPDWADMVFARVPGDTTRLLYACASYQLGQHTTGLAAQRPDQRWSTYFLPDRYQLPSRMARDTNYGGLVGELPLLIAMVAMSLPWNGWSRLLPHIIVQPPHVTGGWQLPAAIEAARLVAPSGPIDAESWSRYMPSRSTTLP